MGNNPQILMTRYVNNLQTLGDPPFADCMEKPRLVATTIGSATVMLA